MECPEIVQKESTRILVDMLRYVKVDFLENVHLCISLREMPKILRPDAKKRFKKYASRSAP